MWSNHVTDRFRHLAALAINHETVRQYFFVRRFAFHRHRRDEG
ncbi:Uncharacterised protein [Vibrio cholerae]|nr:Uncharacterised protein [Vibrio cholerae]